ncbi:hypothetical protein [Streptomyces sp. NPDC006415]|uniref:hypothetical protein n=1 Tax=Streptomyces sp. NPDC006415 TaxID=3155351 RepID=UPI0033BE77BF
MRATATTGSLRDDVSTDGKGGRAGAQHGRGRSEQAQPAPGAPAGTTQNGTLDYNSASINGNANLLIEIAGFLHEGRPDGDLCTMAREPRTHSDVAAQVERFGRFADDQHQDAVSPTPLENRLTRPGG